MRQLIAEPHRRQIGDRPVDHACNAVSTYDTLTRPRQIPSRLARLPNSWDEQPTIDQYVNDQIVDVDAARFTPEFRRWVFAHFNRSGTR